MVLQVITANHLEDGLAVFYTREGEWHHSIDHAVLVEQGELADQFLVAASDAGNQLVVVDPYLIDVKQEGGRYTPSRYREMIRTLGPSVRTDLGYQAK